MATLIKLTLTKFSLIITQAPQTCLRFSDECATRSGVADHISIFIPSMSHLGPFLCPSNHTTPQHSTPVPPRLNLLFGISFLLGIGSSLLDTRSTITIYHHCSLESAVSPFDHIPDFLVSSLCGHSLMVHTFFPLPFQFRRVGLFICSCTTASFPMLSTYQQVFIIISQASRSSAILTHVRLSHNTFQCPNCLSIRYVWPLKFPVMTLH